MKIQAAWTVPGSAEVHLASGEWEVYELTGTVSGSSIGPFSYTQETGGPVTIDSTEIHVADPLGRSIADRERFTPTSFQTYKTGSRIYTGVASFDLRAEGRYRITVAGSGEGQVILARPPFAGFASIAGWIVGCVAGSVALVVGLVLFFVDLDRRRRTRMPAPPQHRDERRAGSTAEGGRLPGGAMAGWHPDPSGRNQYRYWNGATWTEHVSTDGATSMDPL